MYPLPPFLLPTIYQFSGERREKATGFVLETDGRSTDPTAIYRNVCSAAYILIDLSQPLKIEPLGNNSCEERLHGYTTRQKKITVALVTIAAARFQFHNFFFRDELDIDVLSNVFHMNRALDIYCVIVG
jgi:hypothetical protein